jgi:hypothetical protein
MRWAACPHDSASRLYARGFRDWRATLGDCGQASSGVRCHVHGSCGSWAVLHARGGLGEGGGGGKREAGSSGWQEAAEQEPEKESRKFRLKWQKARRWACATRNTHEVLQRVVPQLRADGSVIASLHFMYVACVFLCLCQSKKSGRSCLVRCFYKIIHVIEG